MVERAPLRIGTLGAARITPMALVRPARKVETAEVYAVAARDEARARKFAAKHRIPVVHPSYEALIDDPAIDAVYNPLPNALHAEWTIRALQAGKHVLCEKPLASNADEAERMAHAAKVTGRHLVEAFHWRYHPLAARMRQIVREELGVLSHVEARLFLPLPLPRDIRFSWELAGGAMMDTGCYTVNVIRFLSGEEPEVVRAEAKLASPQVDRAMAADFRFPSGASGRIVASLFSSNVLSLRAVARGDAGEMSVFNYIAPGFYNRLRLRIGTRITTERVQGDHTYVHQLRDFVEQVRGGPRMSSDGEDGVRNMRVIDAVYDKAGLKRRGT